MSALCYWRFPRGKGPAVSCARRKRETMFEKVPKHIYVRIVLRGTQCFYFFSSHFGSNPNKLLCFNPPHHCPIHRQTPYPCPGDRRAIKPHYNSPVYLVTWKNIVSVFATDVFQFMCHVDRPKVPGCASATRVQ